MEDNGYISYALYLTITFDGDFDALTVSMINEKNGSWVEIKRHDTDLGGDWNEVIISTDEIKAKGLTPSNYMQVMFSALSELGR